MATWTVGAKKAWAAGMESEKLSNLNSMQQVDLQKSAEKFADGIGKNDSESTKTFAAGSTATAKFIVKITAKRGEINGVAFGTR